MKQEYDKEIDSLLRRGARLAAAAPRSAASSRAAFASSHLDADELSAFAENALPAAARLAAASHLADCDECRGMVVQLASAADTAGEIEKRAAATPVVPVEVPWWKTLLGSLFAPRVLRYAAPALVLGLVGVVSFIALRPRQGSVPATVSQQTAETRDAGAAPSGSAATTTGTTAVNNTGTDASLPTTNNTSPTIGSGGVLAPASPAKPGEQSPGSQPVAPTVLADRDAAPADAAGTGVAGKTSGPVTETVEVEGKAETTDRLAANTVAAPAPAPPPAAKSAGTEVNEMPKGVRNAEPARSTEAEGYDYTARAQQESRAANQARSRQGEMQMPDGASARNESRAMNNRGNVGGVNQLPMTRSERPAAKRGRSDDGKARESAKDDEVVRVDATRSVGGRRFRREGGAWVDVNYKPSMSMTAVRRGTEGYRALVADIPELGRIAEQLGGEVITVVKGRAYRIR